MNAGPDPVVTTTSGRVRGTRLPDGTARFRSVPYAAPPVGDLRYAAPAAALAWDGVRVGPEPGPTAPQSTRGIPGLDLAPILGPGWVPGDDYLTADVWTPDPGGSGLAVMVFLHGGAWVAGTGSAPVYDGAAFARDGVVLLTVNYRLGVEGFLPVPGGATNVGLRDQLAALAWVRDNAAAFGGDPDRVTVFGESAGAMNIAGLLSAPPARGLFGRAIVQSGHDRMVRTVAGAQPVVAQLAGLLGVSPDVAGFRSAAVADAIAAQATATLPENRLDLRDETGTDPTFGITPFLPVTDDVLPADAPLDGTVELLIGSNTEEMNLYFVPSGIAAVATAEQVLAMVGAVHPDAAGVLGAYGLGGPAAPGEVLCTALTDLVFRLPALDLAARFPGRAYVYEFAWRSPATGGRLGACHAVELPFVFGTLDVAGELAAGAPAALADDVRRAWIAFATSGDPGWPAYTGAEPPVWTFDTESALVSGPAGPRTPAAAG